MSQVSAWTTDRTGSSVFSISTVFAFSSPFGRERPVFRSFAWTLVCRNIAMPETTVPSHSVATQILVLVLLEAFLAINTSVDHVAGDEASFLDDFAVTHIAAN